MAGDAGAPEAQHKPEKARARFSGSAQSAARAAMR